MMEGSSASLMGARSSSSRASLCPLTVTKRRRSSSPGEAHKQLILLVAHVVDALADLFAVFLGEEVLQLAAVFGLEHFPTPLVEHRLERAGADSGDDAVEALAVEVDDPDGVAEFGHPVVEDSLPDIAFIQFCVADDGDEAVGGDVAEVPAGVVVCQGGEGGGDGAEADGAGGKVDRVGVLGCGWG